MRKENFSERCLIFVDAPYNLIYQVEIACTLMTGKLSSARVNFGTHF